MPTSRLSTPRRLLAVVLGLSLIGMAGVLGTDGSSRSTGQGTNSGAAPAAERIDAPGFDADPGPFSQVPAAEATGDTVHAAFTSSPDATRTAGDVGLSFEATDLASPLWGSPDSNLEAMLEALDRPTLRFGGNSVDRRMWWTSTGEPAPGWAEATVTPGDLRRVAAAARSTGSRVTIVVDLGHDDPERAADMAAHAREAFGDDLVAVSVGNEPNGYALSSQPQLRLRDDTWTPSEYRKDLRAYADAIDAASPGTPLAGPGTFDAAWWRAFTAERLPHTVALTMHWYPLWDCKGPDSSIANPTVEDLTSPKLRQQAHKIVGMGAAEAQGNDLPLWIEETGPTSCPGTNDTSRTHAQALWTADFVLTTQEIGAQRIAFHSTLQACRGGAPMSPICATGPLEDPGEQMQGRTSYLALLQLGWLPDGRVLSPQVSGDGEVMVHGVLGDDGSIAILVVDMRDPAQGEGAVPVTVSAPSGDGIETDASWTMASGSRLSGASLDAEASSLGALAPVAGDLAGQRLSGSADLTLTSSPGSSTLLVLSPSGP